MSIWIDLLFMHGHFATPRVLEHLLTPATPPAEPPAAKPDECTPGPGAGVVSRPAVLVHHPLRVVGQLS